MQAKIARIYITESNHSLTAIMKHLHDEIKVKGVTVFRAFSGFGESGVLHTSQLLTMSLDLPLVIEFFDEASKVVQAIQKISSLVGSGHIISWPIEIHCEHEE